MYVIRYWEYTVRVHLFIRRLLRRARRDKGIGATLLLTVVVVSVLGNALTFFFFERLSERDLDFFDALWYSIVSITTIGYGDFSAVSTGARVGTIIFIVVVGLVAFTSAVGLLVDWILDIQYKEKAGMTSVGAKGHLLIVNFPNEGRVRQIIEEFTHDSHHRNHEVVIATDQIESLPFSYNNVSFVRGSPLEEDTYLRANLSLADQAIVLSTGYDDSSSSDSIVASAVSIIEHIKPEIKIVAECLNEKHTLLFQKSGRVSLVYTLRLANNLLVQEAQDPGVNLLTQAITSNRIDGTLASTRVEDGVDSARPYLDIAKVLLDKDINLIGVIRDGTIHVNFGSLTLAGNDSLVYISTNRYTWESLRSVIS